MGWVVSFLRGMFAVGKWLVKVAASVVKWAAVHPLAAIVVGTVAVVGALWIDKQPWAGAEVLSTVVSYVGTSILFAGLGGWVVKALLPGPVKFIRTLGEQAYDYLLMTHAVVRWLLPWLPPLTQ